MSTKKRGLGRGLSALISEDVLIEEDSFDKIINIDVKKLVPNKNQPRLDFKDENLKELANSIEINGIIQPIVVRKVGKKYEIIAGERRLRASKLIGLKEVPCIVKDIDEVLSAKLAIIENIQREDLNAVEEAASYKKLIEEYNLTQEELSNEVGKSRSHISNSIRILSLDKKILQYIIEKNLTLGHAKVLLGLKEKTMQMEIAELVVENGLSVRQLENIIEEKQQDKDNNKEEDKKSNARKPNKASNITSLEENLMNALGTKVNLKGNNKKGKIEIEYYGLEDLDRIIEILTK